VNYVSRIFLFALTALILSLNVGIDMYSVHCDMRNKTYVSLLTAYDPCFSESVDKDNASCCASQSHCAEDDSENEDDSCCDEEQITITYEPDFVNNFLVNALIQPSILLPKIDFSFSSKVAFSETKTIEQFPQPPPLSGREILTFHAVLRI
jgi:hypothetical protein